jgi:soluble lytic murein transglycosylase-like protein
MDARLLAILMQSRLLTSRRFSDHNASFLGAGPSFSTLLIELMARPEASMTDGSNGKVEGGDKVSQQLPLSTRKARQHGRYAPYLYPQPGTSSQARLNQVNAASEFDALIHKTAAQYDVDPVLVKAVVRQESGFNPSATSRVGAAGLMQLMPATARELGVANIYDPQQNLDGGVRYLKSMIDRYNGDVTLALAAYNAGPGNVDRYGGVPPFSETQLYVKNVLATITRV